MDLHSTIRS